MASVASSQSAKGATVDFKVLGMMFDSCVETVDRAVRKMEWLSVVDARVILPMELAQVDFEEATPSATPDQRCCCEDRAAQWSVSFEVF